jgi:hypothetical protein
MPFESFTPGSVGQQTPMRAGRLQATHGPLHAELQQTPLAQNPDWQSVLALQLAPGIRLPQLPVESHTWLEEQLLLELHSSKQALVLGSQEKGTQMTVGPGRHCPIPSQMPTSITESPEHVPWLHIVPAGNIRQLPLPSHLPSSPQTPTAVGGQSDALRGSSPVALETQVPSEPDWLQVRQPDWQASLQQTPSTQKSLAHSCAQLQDWPAVFLAPPAVPQLPPVPLASPEGWSPTWCASVAPPSWWLLTGGPLLPRPAQPATANATHAATMSRSRIDTPDPHAIHVC